MAVRCSLLGHDYGDPEVDREREERGSEVVVTVQEFEACSRCGKKNVLSENTEVTSLESEGGSDETGAREPAGSASDGTGATDEAASETSESASDSEEPGSDQPDPATPDRAVTTTDSVTVDVTGTFEEATADEPPTGEFPTDEHGEPITDDAEILDDDGDDKRERKRGHGEWPEPEDVGPPVGADGPAPEWPDSDESSDQPAEDEVTDDGVVLDADDVTAPPAEPDSTVTSAAGIERAGEAPTPADPQPREDGPTEYFCPGCSFVASGDRGSLRPGDICPECKKGYLAERNR